jgi:hypothetical protein
MSGTSLYISLAGIYLTNIFCEDLKKDLGAVICREGPYSHVIKYLLRKRPQISG